MNEYLQREQLRALRAIATGILGIGLGVCALLVSPTVAALGGELDQAKGWMVFGLGASALVLMLSVGILISGKPGPTSPSTAA